MTRAEESKARSRRKGLARIAAQNSRKTVTMQSLCERMPTCETGPQMPHGTNAGQAKDRCATDEAAEAGPPRKAKIIRRPGKLSEVPPYCFKRDGMTVEQATVAAVDALGLKHPIDLLTTYWPLLSERPAEASSAMYSGDTAEIEQQSDGVAFPPTFQPT